MMTFKQLLLLQLAEEACEIGQACSKVIRFGDTERLKDNLKKEITDLLATIDLLNDHGFDFKLSCENINLKKDKILKYHKESMGLNLVQPIP